MNAPGSIADGKPRRLRLFLCGSGVTIVMPTVQTCRKMVVMNPKHSQISHEDGLSFNERVWGRGILHSGILELKTRNKQEILKCNVRPNTQNTSQRMKSGAVRNAVLRVQKAGRFTIQMEHRLMGARSCIMRICSIVSNVRIPKLDKYLRQELPVRNS